MEKEDILGAKQKQRGWREKQQALKNSSGPRAEGFAQSINLGARPKVAGSGRLSTSTWNNGRAGSLGTDRNYKSNSPNFRNTLPYKPMNNYRGASANRGSYSPYHIKQHGPGRAYQEPPNVLNTNTLTQLTTEAAEPSVIIRKLTDGENGLKKLLEDDPSSWELMELALVAMGRFCEKNGVTSFNSGFMIAVRILADKRVFQNVPNIVIQISIAPISPRLSGLPSKEERLGRLIKSVCHLVTEMVVLMPAFTSNCLGENFFADIYGLKDIPSVKNLKKGEVFETLQEAGAHFKTAWEHNQDQQVAPSEAGDQVKPLEMRHEEELDALLKPPDDFRLLNIMPEVKDLSRESEPFIRANVIKGSYPTEDSYLDIQFRLLREDFFYPLRQGINEYKDMLNSQPRGVSRHVRIDSLRLYYGVKILNQVFKEEETTSTESTFTIQFSVADFQRVNWEQSKRLTHGSLLMLSVDNFASFLLFTVADRDSRDLVKGQFKAIFQGSSLPAYAWKQPMVMAESSVFFEAYRSTLIALQKFSPIHFPLKEYILGRSFQPTLPGYLVDVEAPIYNLEDVVPLSNVDAYHFHEQDYPLSHVPILDEVRRPGADILGLDPSQARALYAALTRKLAVIQGPPGTGKTYLGLKIVNVLLSNKDQWDGEGYREPEGRFDRFLNDDLRRSSGPPILVVCYTNHALDQFLEGIMKFTRNIVRIGSRSKCEAMQQFSLYEWKKNRGGSWENRQWCREGREKLEELTSDLEKCRVSLELVESFSGILHEDALLSKEIISPELHAQFGTMRAMFYWMRNLCCRYNNSVLPLWLCSESVQELENAVRMFNAPASNIRQISQKGRDLPVNPVVPEPADNEEEEGYWDKEDIEAFQRERMIDDDDFEPLVVKRDPGWGGKRPRLLHETKPTLSLTISGMKSFIDKLKDDTPQLQGDDVEWTEWMVQDMQARLNAISRLISMLPKKNPDKLLAGCGGDLLRLTCVERWMLYLSWKVKYVEKLEHEIGRLEEECHRQALTVKDIRTMETAALIREADIVGITTTGAAKHRALLEPLKARIVIVEEAAEVLEAHIVTSLSSSCQHLILIGDHQQLRPSTAVFHLARKYHLDISLFERMILNGMEPCVLEVQHRMRPEVASLIVPSIYPHLLNHESVENYGHVPGMLKDVFFLDHTELEQGDVSDQESRSHMNKYEAVMTLALARYLLLQGIEKDKITILTTYAGQLLHLMKLRREQSALQGVRIAVVDNFQGEENDIIILSLVRSNREGKVGFLKTKNRICVALSRAKKGFYILGNMGNLATSELWKQIQQVLESNDHIGPHFSLHCSVHDVTTKAKTEMDFPPEGGCLSKCMVSLSCGHKCPRICHAQDRDHLNHKCKEACNRFCIAGHACPKKCFEDCHPCMTQVPTMLPCTHLQTIRCYEDPTKVFCLAKVTKILLECNHRVEMECGQAVETARCPEVCGEELECGHVCEQDCHSKKSHNHINCGKPCSRSCPEGHPCPKRCNEACRKCVKEVVKILPCGHEMLMECGASPDEAYCGVKVEKILSDCQHMATFDCSQSTEGISCMMPCGREMCVDGHVCRKLCCKPCGPCNVRMERQLSCGHLVTLQCHLDPRKIKCKVMKNAVLPACGHKTKIRCGDGEDAHCNMPCDIRLECGHKCTQRCHVREDPTHQNYQCKKPCERTKANCKQDHKCGKKCFEECNPCRIRVKRTLPCGHSVFTSCGLNDREIYCEEMVMKSVEGCDHVVRDECSSTPVRSQCEQPCTKQLSCGHPCRKECKEECSSADCHEQVPSTAIGLCGHPMTRRCCDMQLPSGNAPNEADLVEFLQRCPEPCRAVLSCGHSCKGTCGLCFNGRVHQACQEKCGRTLVCGHACKVDCGSTCPPCKELCFYRCRHSRCPKKCCEPCSNCMEPCEWTCEHFKCTKKCAEKCNRPPCDQPCKNVLKCGHGLRQNGIILFTVT